MAVGTNQGVAGLAAAGGQEAPCWRLLLRRVFGEKWGDARFETTMVRIGDDATRGDHRCASYGSYASAVLFFFSFVFFVVFVRQSSILQ